VIVIIFLHDSFLFSFLDSCNLAFNYGMVQRLLCCHFLALIYFEKQVEKLEELSRDRAPFRESLDLRPLLRAYQLLKLQVVLILRVCTLRRHQRINQTAKIINVFIDLALSYKSFATFCGLKFLMDLVHDLCY
jgi:hypothetical protein